MGADHDLMLPTAPRLQNVSITADSFWGRRRHLNRTVTIPEQLRLIRETGRIAACTGNHVGSGHRFWDSDCGKWLEAAWSELAGGGDSEALRRGAEEVHAALAAAQEDDGYLQSHIRYDRHAYGTWWSGDGRRWQNMLESHELYSMGHVIEALCAQHETCNGDDGLAMAQRILDLIWREFGPEGRPWWCGHPEIELALMRLFYVTGDPRAQALCARMIDVRGPTGMIDEELQALGRKREDCWFAKYDQPFSYVQAAVPVAEAKDLDGHAVRAVYLACGITDLILAGDTRLVPVMDRLWDSAVHRRMHVTGGLGAHPEGERMGQDYDLPDERAYCETCASIGLARWARRLLDHRLEAEYGDVLELALHNAVLAGVSLDGRSYFYSNPISIHPQDSRDRDNLSRNRSPWFGCACCPTNLARTISQIAALATSVSSAAWALHLYLPGEIAHGGLRLHIASGLPLDGQVAITVVEAGPDPIALSLRIPAWTEHPVLTVAGGPLSVQPGTYATILRTWSPGDTVVLDLPMPVKRLHAHPAVRQAVGQVAIRRGPLIWCLEEADNGPGLTDCTLADDAGFSGPFEIGGIPRITVRGTRSASGSQALYGTSPAARVSTSLHFVPYFAWGNRGFGEMRVWVRRDRN